VGGGGGLVEWRQKNDQVGTVSERTQVAVAAFAEIPEVVRTAHIPKSELLP
jgi:hypothetical protein